MAHLPWIKFFKTDWLQEPSLRLCSRAARSLWLDMLCLMHDAQPCGELRLKDKALSERQLAAVLGDSEKEVRRLLAELEAAGVFSRSEDGVIFCRRMKRDAEKSVVGQQSAQRRWGQQRAGADVAANGSATGCGDVPGNDQAIAQTPDARLQQPESESDSSEYKNREGGEFAVTGATASGSTAALGLAAIAAEPAAGSRRKRPERADQHLAQHMMEHGRLDGGVVWALIAAARDAKDPRHDEAARQCEEYSRRFRIGWFADEAAWSPPALAPGAVAGALPAAPPLPRAQAPVTPRTRTVQRTMQSLGRH
jgi:hypothetical protein